MKSYISRMKILLLLLMLCSNFSFAQNLTKLERINFFPNADAFFIAGYEYARLNMATPKSTVKVKEVNNYYNFLKMTYAQKVTSWMFLGLAGQFQKSSENGVRYGMASRRRFEARGFKEPEIFILTRPRLQSNHSGLIDFSLSYSPGFHRKEVGSDSSNVLNSREIIRTSVSHGMFEDEWEFRTTFEFSYYGKSKENNDFTGMVHNLEANRDFGFNFNTQYCFNKWLYVHVTVGVLYQDVQHVVDENGGRQEMQSGTASVFKLGLKRPLGDWSLVQISYKTRRNDYFVKGELNNIDGKEKLQNVVLELLHAF